MPTWWAAMATLAPLVLGPGVCGVLVAWLGVLKAARDGRPPATIGPASLAGIGVALGASDALAQVGPGLERQADASGRIAEHLARVGDALAETNRTLDETAKQLQELRYEMGRRERGWRGR